MASPVSSFYATVGIQTRVADLRRVDRYLALIEKKMAKMTANLQKSMGNVKLPPLTVKKVKIDELAAQRAAQTSLNRIGRLLELKVGRVALDEDRITRQVQNVFTRASSKARMSVRTIAGSSGGANVHWPGTGYIPRNIPHLPSMPSASSFGDAFGGGSMGAGLGGFIPRIGAGGLIAGGIVGAGYMGVQQTSQLNNQQVLRESQRIALDVASGADTRQGRDDMNKRFLDLTNRLGLNAEKNVDAYAQAMKQLQGAGLSADDAFKLFENVSIATKGSGLTDDQNSRQLYAITQTFGKQALMSEELSQQLGDANAGIKRFVQEVWQDRTGKSGMEAFLKDMEARKVTPDMLAEAYARQAAYVAPRVEEFASSAQSAQNRLANQRFAEELQRTMDDEVVPSVKRFTEAQAELHKATAPFRDSLYSLAAAGTSLAARFVSITAKTLEKAPAMRNEASNEQRSTAPMASSMGRGLLSVPDSRGIRKAPVYQLNAPSPLLNQTKPWQVAAEAVYQPESLDQMVSRIQSNTTNVTSTRSIVVEPGAFQIQTQAQDAEALALELEPAMRRVFDEALDDQLTETNISFGSK